MRVKRAWVGDWISVRCILMQSQLPPIQNQLSEYTTPQKSTSIPYCGSCFILDCDEAIKPNKGMVFDDLESAKEFYESYAHTDGFSVRIGQHKKVDGLVLYKHFLCANEGFREEKGEKDLDFGSEKSQRRSYEKRITRGGCEAKLVLKLTDGNKYVVIGFEQGHTHGFVSPDKRHLIRSNRKLTLSARSTLLACHKASIGTSQAYRYLRVGAGVLKMLGSLKGTYRITMVL